MKDVTIDMLVERFGYQEGLFQQVFKGTDRYDFHGISAGLQIEQIGHSLKRRFNGC